MKFFLLILFCIYLIDISFCISSSSSSTTTTTTITNNSFDNSSCKDCSPLFCNHTVLLSCDFDSSNPTMTTTTYFRDCEKEGFCTENRRYKTIYLEIISKNCPINKFKRKVYYNANIYSPGTANNQRIPGNFTIKGINTPNTVFKIQPSYYYTNGFVFIDVSFTSFNGEIKLLNSYPLNFGSTKPC